MFARSQSTHFRLVSLLAAMLVLAVACTALPSIPDATPASQVATPEATAALPGGMPPVGAGAAVDAARSTLAIELGLPLADVRVVSSEQVNWRDGCLETSRPEVACLLVITPGYRIILEANGQRYEVRTDADGSVVVSAGPHAVPQPVKAAVHTIAQLASQLGLELNDVRVVSTERMDWADACLGAPAEGEMCAQVITPGYRIVLEANNLQYTFHTDEEGRAIRPVPSGASTPGATEGDTIAGWRQIGSQGCMEVFFGAEGVRFGKCGGELTVTDFLTTTHRLAQLLDMQAVYASFAADTPAGKVAFNGRGPVQAGPAEQRMVAEWAAVVYNELQVGGDVAQWGLSWRREGGIAGFCDDLAIDASGHAILRSCAKEPAKDVRWRRLTETELAQFYVWLDTLGSFEHKQTDNAQADAMTISVLFAGRTEAQPTDADQQALSTFVSEVLAQWAGPTDIRYVVAQTDVNIHTGPGEQFAQSGQVAAGQTALVTGVSRDGAWWRVVCADDKVGSCFVSADPAATQPVMPPPTPGADPTAVPQVQPTPPSITTPTAGTTKPADATAILAAVIRRVYTVDHTFASSPNFPQVYLLQVDDTESGALPFGNTPVAVDPTVRAEVIAALSDLPGKIEWVLDANGIQRDESGLVAGHGAIITVGKIRPQTDGSVQIAASIYIGSLTAGGQTYVLQQVDDSWEITGKTGPTWIS